MSGFTLDTSGRVEIEGPLGVLRDVVTWPDLSPFEQGYIEALFASSNLWKFGRKIYPHGEHDVMVAAFSDLAPEALAAIRKDCAAFCNRFPRLGPAPASADNGREFWRERQTNFHASFPPQAVALGEDGKVRVS